MDDHNHADRASDKTVLNRHRNVEQRQQTHSVKHIGTELSVIDFLRFSGHQNTFLAIAAFSLCIV